MFDLLTETGVLLGFLLFAGPSGIEDGTGQRDCTFTQSQSSPTDHALAAVIAFAQGRTYRCKVRANGNDVSVLVHIHEGMSVLLDHRADGSCQWHVEKLFGRSAVTGQCSLHSENS